MPHLVRKLEQIGAAIARQSLARRLDIGEIHNARAEFPCLLIGSEMDVTWRAATAVFQHAEMQGELQLLRIRQLLVAKHQHGVFMHARMNRRDLV